MTSLAVGSPARRARQACDTPTCLEWHSEFMGTGIAWALSGERVLGAAVVAWRVHRRRAPDSLPMAQRAVQALPAPQQSTAALPAPERPAELHLHFHGLTAEEAAAVLRRAIEDDSARCASRARPGAL